MPSAKELRDELRAMRKEAVKPVSKMRKGDVAAEIEKLKAGREETPAPAATPSSATKKKMISAVEDVTSAKRMEFPQKPSAGMKKSATAAGKPSAADGSKKKSKLDKLMAMMDEMTDTDDE